MTTVREILNSLYTAAPPELKEPWDNVGLLCGNGDLEVRGVLIALDVTMPVLQEAKSLGCNLVVTHHPIIFGEIASVTDCEPTGKLLLYAIENGIACVNLHTNLDKAEGGVNDILAQKLHLQGVEKLGDYLRGGTVKEATLKAYAQTVKDTLGCSGVRYADGGKPVHRVAVGGGACADEIALAASAGCDTLVTADIKYHQFLQASLWGVNLIDAGHFQTENPVTEHLKSRIVSEFPDIPCEISRVHDDPIRFL